MYKINRGNRDGRDIAYYSSGSNCGSNIVDRTKKKALYPNGRDRKSNNNHTENMIVNDSLPRTGSVGTGFF